MAYVINGGTAAITVSGAVCSSLYLGDPNSANSGTIQMSGGSLSAAFYEFLGNNSGMGTFAQYGGTNNIAYGVLYLASDPGSSGSYSLSGSGMLLTPTEYVGNICRHRLPQEHGEAIHTPGSQGTDRGCTRKLRGLKRECPACKLKSITCRQRMRD